MADQPEGCARVTGAVLGESPPEVPEAPHHHQAVEEDSMTARVGHKAPDFNAPAYLKGSFTNVQLSDSSTLRESAACLAGDEPVVVPVGGFQLGLSICYDLRFPELYRALVDRGADVLLVPAAFTMQTGQDHWHVLARARAIEAQSWVVAPNQWGRHPGGRVSYGHSVIIDPWGTIVAECSDRVGLALGDIDRGLLQSVRHRLPSLQHRRL